MIPRPTQVPVTETPEEGLDWEGFPDRLEIAMNSRQPRWTVGELGKAIGKASGTVVSLWRSKGPNRRRPTETPIRLLLAQKLGVRYDWLFKGRGPGPGTPVQSLADQEGEREGELETFDSLRTAIIMLLQDPAKRSEARRLAQVYRDRWRQSVAARSHPDEVAELAADAGLGADVRRALADEDEPE